MRNKACDDETVTLRDCKIRSMHLQDCAQVADIDSRCILNPWTEQAFRDTFRYPENDYLVAEWEERVIGFVGLIRFVDDGDITHIAVLPTYRRKGIATALLQEVFARMRRSQMLAVHLEVRAHNMGAQQFYKKLGFEQLAVRKNYYSQPREDAIVMVKQL